jgi:hypothetical protein
MRTRMVIISLVVVLFLGGCGCGFGGFFGQGYYRVCHYDVCPDHCTDCYNMVYYSQCDSDWHNPLCSEKLYSYAKIKRIDFPVDYRTRYNECCLTAPTPYCNESLCNGGLR